MARGLYGQTQGDETRTAGAKLGERIADNEIAEGTVVATFRAMMIDKARWAQVDPYAQGLKAKGWSQARIDSCIRRATYDLRL